MFKFQFQNNGTSTKKGQNQHTTRELSDAGIRADCAMDGVDVEFITNTGCTLTFIYKEIFVNFCKFKQKKSETRSQ